MREEHEIRELAEVARRQQEVSRARDYWEGVEDAIAYIQGEEVAPLEANLLAYRRSQAPNPEADLKASIARHPAGSQRDE